MARLPDVQDMGGRPVAGVQGPVRFQETRTADTGGGLTVLGEAFLKVQYQDDQLRAEDGINQLQKQKLDLTNGEEGFNRVKSGDVVSRPIYKDYTDQFDKHVDSISKGFDNDQQRGFFQRRAELLKLQYGTDLTNHIQREKDTHSKQVFKGGQAIELQNASEHWDEPNAIAFSLERTKKLIEQQADKEGWANDVTKIQKIGATSNIHSSVINQALSTDNPEYASAWFEKNKKDIDATQHPKIESLIRKGSIKVLSQEVTDDVMLRGLDEKSALSEIRKKYKGEEENAIIRSVKNRFNEEDRIQDENQKSSGEEAWDIFAKTGDFDQIPITTLDEMKGKDRESLRAYADKQNSGQPTQTDYKVWDELVGMAKENPAEFDKLSIDTFRPFLDNSHMDKFIGLRSNKVEIDYLQSQLQLSKEAASKAGLDTKAAGKDNDEGKALSAFYNNLNEKVGSFQISKGRKPDDKELTEIMDNMILNKVYVDEWFGDPEKPISTLTDEELKEAYVEVEGVEVKLTEIPDLDRVDIIRKRMEYGLPVTEEAIARSWLITQGRL